MLEDYEEIDNCLRERISRSNLFNGVNLKQCSPAQLIELLELVKDHEYTGVHQ